VNSQLLEQGDRRHPFLGGESGGGTLHRRRVVGERTADQSFARFGKVDHTRPPVARMLTALHQPLGFHAVNRRRDRPAGQVYQFTDRVYGSRPLMEDNLEDSEVGETEAQGMYVTDRVGM